jgi:methyl-accepting chemotaxis protein
VQQNFAASTVLADLAQHGEELRRYEKEYFIFIGDLKRRVDYSKQWQQGYDEIMTTIGGIKSNRASIWNAADQAEAAKWEASVAAYGNGFDSLRKRVAANEISSALEANNAIREAKDKFKIFVSGTNETLKRKNSQSQELAAKINSGFETILLVSALLSATATILLVVLGVVVLRAIEAPIHTLAEVAKSISTGDLEHPFALRSSVKEFRALAEHLERMRIAQKGLLDSLLRRKSAAQA